MGSETEVKKTGICCSTARCDIFSGNCCCSWSCNCCSWSCNCCSLSFPKKRLNLKEMKKKALSALCLASSTHSAAASSPVKPKPMPKAGVVVATLEDSHRTESVKACIEYINATSSSSMKLSTSASASSSSSTSSGPKPDSQVPSK